MVKISKKALDNVVMYTKIIRDRNMFVLVGLMIVLLISALIKYFNVLEGFKEAVIYSILKNDGIKPNIQLVLCKSAAHPSIEYSFFNSSSLFI